MRASEEMQGAQTQSGEEALAGDPETWEAWETWLVTSSVVAGALGLLVLGWLVDRFILS